MKKYFLTLLITLFTIQAQALSVGECVKNLPDEIEFTHVKDPMHKMAETFTDYEKDNPGLGYGIMYHNNLCNVSLYVYNMNLDHITADDIMLQQQASEEAMLSQLSEERNTVDQVYVTYVGENFFKIRATCALLYTGDEMRYNEMLTRVVSSVIEENVTPILEECLSIPAEQRKQQ